MTMYGASGSGCKVLLPQRPGKAVTAGAIIFCLQSSDSRVVTER